MPDTSSPSPETLAQLDKLEEQAKKSMSKVVSNMRAVAKLTIQYHEAMYHDTHLRLANAAYNQLLSQVSIRVLTKKERQIHRIIEGHDTEIGLCKTCYIDAIMDRLS